MPFSNTPWSNFKQSDYNDEQWKSACLIVDNQCLQNGTAKACCKLPVKEPNGTYNINGLRAAFAALRGARGGVQSSPDLKEKAMTRLRTLYKEAGLEMPEPLAANFSLEDPKGIAWKAGKHHVWIGGKPKTLYVPRETIIPTYKKLKDKLDTEGINLGVDHLDEKGVDLDEFEILAKMAPLSVGSVKNIATDGEAIYVTRSELYNSTVQDLHIRGELPAFSIIGPLDVSECERKDIDFVLKDLDIERIDFVERGGCQECLVSDEEPRNLVLTGNSSKEEKKMPEKKKEKVDETNVDQTQTNPVDEVQKTEEKTEEGATEEVTRLDKIEKTLADLTTIVSELATSKTDKVVASLAKEIREDKAENKVRGYIAAGYAVPKEEEVLKELAIKDPDLFEKVMASRPKIVTFGQDSVFTSETELDEEDDLTVEEAAKAMGIDLESP